MSAPPPPSHPENLTPAFLTHTLRAGGVLDTGAVDDLKWEVVGEEFGFTGVVARIWPQYIPVDSHAPRSLIAKFPLATRGSPSLYQQQQRRDEVSHLRLYQRAAREVSFYQEIVPQCPVPAPRLYYGAADTETQGVLLLLEDLHGRHGDVLAGATTADAGLVLDAVAPLHAHWWQNRRLDTVPWLPRWDEDLRARSERYAGSVPGFLARFGARLPPHTIELIQSLVGACFPILSQLAEAPFTLLHGDLHLDNVIFGSPSGGDTPRDAGRVWLLDWQGILRGPAVNDLTFVSWSLPIDRRRTAESPLLRRYHSLLLRHGVSYSFDDILLHYRLALLNNLAGIVAWLGNVDPESAAGRQRAMIEALVEEPRLFTALIDHRAAEVVAQALTQ